MSLIVNTDITDWGDDFNKKKPNVGSNDEIIKRRLEGMHLAEISRHIIAGRELEEVPLDIIKPNKILLMMGGSSEVIGKTQGKTKVELPNGSEVKVRDYVAPVTDGEKNGDDNGISNAIVKSSNKEAAGRAASYLLKVCSGRIYNRLAIIAKYGKPGDVEKFGEQLKAIVDEFMVKLG